MATKQKAKEKKWKPKIGTIYFVIFFSECAIESYPAFVGIWQYNNDVIDRKHINSGNCFRTKTEAKKKCAEINRSIKQILSK